MAHYPFFSEFGLWSMEFGNFITRDASFLLVLATNSYLWQSVTSIGAWMLASDFQTKQKCAVEWSILPKFL